MQTRKTHSGFIHLNRLASIWEKQFPEPISALKSLMKLLYVAWESSVLHAGSSSDQKSALRGAYFNLTTLINRMAIPLIENKGTKAMQSGDDLILACVANCVDLGAFSLDFVFSLFNGIGQVADKEGAYSHESMGYFVKTLHGLTKVCEYFNEHNEAIERETLLLLSSRQLQSMA